MKITESRLRQIIRETLTEMGSPRQIVTVDDVNAVLSALITGPLWDDEKVQELAEKAFRLQRLRRGLAQPVLSGIKGWIENEQNEMGNTTPGFARALDLIDGIARRLQISIVGSDEDEAGVIQGLINRAYTL